jgi:PIN domain nuclease of toxin-antitoxin system
MRLLLDANSFLWWVTGSPRLSGAARQAIADEGNEILVGVGSLWQITIKKSLGKMEFPHDFETVLRDEGFLLLPIAYAHLCALETLPHLHRDPFDRLLIAQSIAEQIPVATADRRFTAYEVDVLW